MSNNNDFSTEKITPLNNLEANLVNGLKLGDNRGQWRIKMMDKTVKTETNRSIRDVREYVVLILRYQHICLVAN